MKNLAGRERLEHIQQAILLIQSFVKTQTLKDFAKDVKAQSATLYQFLVIGEAVRAIDPRLLEKYPYPWHIPRSFRNFIAHEYHRIKLESVYNAALDLERLQAVVSEMLENEF